MRSITKKIYEDNFQDLLTKSMNELVNRHAEVFKAYKELYPGKVYSKVVIDEDRQHIIKTNIREVALSIRHMQRCLEDIGDNYNCIQCNAECDREELKNKLGRASKSYTAGFCSDECYNTYRANLIL